MLLYTGIRRNAHEVLDEQLERTREAPLPGSSRKWVRWSRRAWTCSPAPGQSHSSASCSTLRGRSSDSSPARSRAMRSTTTTPGPERRGRSAASSWARAAAVFSSCVCRLTDSRMWRRRCRACPSRLRFRPRGEPPPLLPAPMTVPQPAPAKRPRWWSSTRECAAWVRHNFSYTQAVRQALEARGAVVEVCVHRAASRRDCGSQRGSIRSSRAAPTTTPWLTVASGTTCTCTPRAGSSGRSWRTGWSACCLSLPTSCSATRWPTSSCWDGRDTCPSGGDTAVWPCSCARLHASPPAVGSGGRSIPIGGSNPGHWRACVAIWDERSFYARTASPFRRTIEAPIEDQSSPCPSLCPAPSWRNRSITKTPSASATGRGRGVGRTLGTWGMLGSPRASTFWHLS